MKKQFVQNSKKLKQNSTTGAGRKHPLMLGKMFFYFFYFSLTFDFTSYLMIIRWFKWIFEKSDVKKIIFEGLSVL